MRCPIQYHYKQSHDVEDGAHTEATAICIEEKIPLDFRACSRGAYIDCYDCSSPSVLITRLMSHESSVHRRTDFGESIKLSITYTCNNLRTMVIVAYLYNEVISSLVNQLRRIHCLSMIIGAYALTIQHLTRMFRPTGVYVQLIPIQLQHSY